MLKVKNLQKNYDFFSLDKLNFQLEKGYVLGIAGANGAGKSTLIKLISKSIKADQGQITYDGQGEYRHLMAYQPADFPFDSMLMVANIVNFYDFLYPNFKKDKCLLKLEEFGIDKKTQVSRLSLGSKQKVMLAMILSLDARLIILDEPTDGIDIFLRDEIIESLQEHLYENDASLIIATHQLEYYEDLLDYILYLEDGKSLFYTDMISFHEEARNYLTEKLDQISLKDFAYRRQKEWKDAEDKRWSY